MQLPFRSSAQYVKPEWIDFNGHLNMAYYNVLFDQAVDELYPQWGFGERYVQETGCTTYVAEFHVCYLRELHVGDEVTCAIHIVDFDEKRFHLYCELFHKDGWLSATSEGLTLHVDQSGPKVAPMPAHILDALAKYKAGQGPLPEGARVGRTVSLKRQS